MFYRLFVLSSLIGVLGDYYVGILLYKNFFDGLRMNDISEEGDVYRCYLWFICNSKSGWKKCFCIGVKDFLSILLFKLEIIKLLYNLIVDVNYMMFVWISSCLYWLKEK